jgi:hypothetical protein
MASRGTAPRARRLVLPLPCGANRHRRPVTAVPTVRSSIRRRRRRTRGPPLAPPKARAEQHADRRCADHRPPGDDGVPPGCTRARHTRGGGRVPAPSPAPRRAPARDGRRTPDRAGRAKLVIVGSPDCGATVKCRPEPARWVLPTWWPLPGSSSGVQRCRSLSVASSSCTPSATGSLLSRLTRLAASSVTSPPSRRAPDLPIPASDRRPDCRKPLPDGALRVRVT